MNGVSSYSTIHSCELVFVLDDNTRTIGPHTPFSVASSSSTNLSGHSYSTEPNEEYESDLGSVGQLILFGVWVALSSCTGAGLACAGQQHAKKRISKYSVSTAGMYRH